MHTRCDENFILYSILSNPSCGCSKLSILSKIHPLQPDMTITLPLFKASMDVYKCNLQYFFHCNNTIKNSFEHYPEFGGTKKWGGGLDLGRSVTQCLAINLCRQGRESRNTAVVDKPTSMHILHRMSVSNYRFTAPQVSKNNVLDL